MSQRNDLTRWNRAGLSRFRYVDGNAIEYLETLRQQLVGKFADPETGLCDWLSPAEKTPSNEVALENETLIQRQERLARIQQRLVDSYRQDRRDLGWEITRTFARACHILTEHVNAYANEAYLGTATQWEHVRRLVDMLDYHPAPPASASTPLALIAKENKTGTVSSGFQVKHSPPDGGPKVIFETLQDLYVDPALNGLRPSGWDELGDLSDLASRPDGNASADQTPGEPRFSAIVQGPVINIQGVGRISSDQLDALAGPEGFRIKDLLELDPDESGTDIGATWLWEWKAKANQLINFAPAGDWSFIEEKRLSEIAAASADELAELTGNSREEAKSLKLEVEIVEICLDQSAYENATLGDLLTPVIGGEALDSVPSPWRAKAKPKVAAGNVAMVMNGGAYVAEAVTIGNVDKPGGEISLRPSAAQYSWYKWKRHDATLFVSPRWKRKCWLNGRDVIRTTEPHGLAAGAFIGWNADWNATGEWRLSELEYAEIVEADKRNLRLKYGYGLGLLQVNQISDVPDAGRAQVIVAMVGGLRLHIRIFDAGGRTVADADESNLLPGRALTALKRMLSPWPDTAGLLPEDKQQIIRDAALSAGHSLLPKQGTALREIVPITDSILSADYEEVVLLNSQGEPDIRGGVLEDVAPAVVESPFDSIFEVNETVTSAPSGGGLLPPAALPKIGSFLFPSPMLPMDLVKAAVELMLSLGVMVIPSSGEVVIKGLPFEGELGALADSLPAGAGMPALADALYGFLAAMVTVDDAGEATSDKLINWKLPEAEAKAELAAVLSKAEGEPSALFQQIKEEIEQSGPLLAVPTAAATKAYVDSALPRYVIEGSVEKITTGAWIVGEFTDGLRALKINAITAFAGNDETETYSLSLEKTDGITAGLQRVYAEFRGELTPEKDTVNETPVDPEKIELDAIPEPLKPGREVLLTADGKEPVAATIEKIYGNSITTNPPAAGFTKGELVILGNVALAGHGEAKPEKILGSGDAAKSNQEFLLEVDQVSFTPDSTMSSGVAAAIEVNVAGRVWEQVSTLKDSAPSDHHYATRMTEDGYVKIIFGDGEYGRRLPSGKNNIRVRYRAGSGLFGNVPAGSLVKPVNPHPLIEEVRQPLPATGGGNMEDVASLRDNAPPTLLALERAVSLSDFSHLAASQSSIWQAKAYSEILHEGRTECVKVVIVPAGGVVSDDMRSEITKFLQKHALPGVHVKVAGFNAVLVDISVTVRVKTDEFVSADVETAVAMALEDHFTLKNRKLGEHLYLSEVYKIVEAVTGVENSKCELFERLVKNGVAERGNAVRTVKAADASTVVYLDRNSGSTLTVTAEEYLP